MKKNLLFISATVFGLIAFGQSRTPSTTTDASTMITLYDLQTNGSSGQRLYYWPSDNTMSAVANWSMQDAVWSDRGTGYNYFNGTSWGSLPTARVESVRTGWPSIQPFGATGECILSHSATTLTFNKRTAKGTGAWSQITLPNPSGVPAMLWPRMGTSGSNHSYIHILALTEPTANGGALYNGMDGALLYIRSTDGGSTWGSWQQLPGMTSSEYTSFSSDNYAFAQPHSDTLAFTAGGSWQDLFLMKSYDEGSTWTKTIIYNSLYNLGGIASHYFYCPDGTMTVALDNNGMAHVAFGLTADSGSRSSSYYNPNIDGVVYWNENMPQLPPSLNPNLLLENNSLVGWVQDAGVFNPPYGVKLATYFTGLSSQPVMVIDNNNELMLVWSSPTTKRDPDNFMLRHLFERTATIVSGTSIAWNNTIHDLTSDAAYLFKECQYPEIAQNTSAGNFFVLFQADDFAGSYVKSVTSGGYSGQTSPDNNTMTVLTVSKTSVGGNSITISSPNGGDYWQIGSVHNITWVSAGVTNVNLEYSADNGSNWTPIISGYSAGIGSYAWTIPNTPSTHCIVRISDSGNPLVNDISNLEFTITSSPPSIAVTSPNGGQTWQVGNVYSISWASPGVTNVKIQYTIDNGSNWMTIKSSYPANYGTYAWTVPSTPSTQCKMKISDSGNASISDESDAVFTIPPALSVDPGRSAAQEVQMYPNPTTGVLKVIFHKPIHKVYIFNSMGIRVQAFQVDQKDQKDQKEMTLDLSSLGKGVYFVQLTIENKTEVHKIVVL